MWLDKAHPCVNQWFEAVAVMTAPRILECGTGAWDGREARHHKAEILAANPSALWIGTDAKAGDGVDIVADLHEIAAAVSDPFDAVFCASVLEHVQRPWIVAEQLALITRPGGLLFVQTHQAFPLHGYPEDYWRFTKESLALLFGTGGWRLLVSEYTCPARVIPIGNQASAMGWNFEAEAWLNVDCLSERVG